MSGSDENRRPAGNGRRQRGIFERPRGSGVWWVRYHDEHGREHREKIGPKKLAGDVYRKRKTEIAERRFFPERFKQQDEPLVDAIRDFMARKGSTKLDLKGAARLRAVLV